MDHQRGCAMIWKLVLFCLLAGVSGNTLAQVNALPPTRHILVYGDAQARAIPDRFKLTVDFEVLDPQADVARRKVEAHVTDTLAKLEDAGVPANEIVATSLEIEPRERFDDDADEQVFLGIAVSRKLTAKFRDQQKLESFLGRMETSREVTVSGVTTELSDEPELRAKLREKAIASSREKAEGIALAYGARLGAVYSVSDVAPQFSYGIREGSWPSMYQWNRSEGDATSLDRIEVTGSRIDKSTIESFRTGYVNYDAKIYAVFLLAD